MAKARTPRTTRPTAAKKAFEPPQVVNRSSSESLEAEIRVRAYELYERRGRTPGLDEEDWLRAEREVMSRPAD